MIYARCRADTQVQIEKCSAGADGGAIYTVVPLRFVVASPTSSSVLSDVVGTTVVGNVAGSNGGGIAAWATLLVDFGHSLVGTDPHMILLLVSTLTTADSAFSPQLCV